MWNRRIKQQYSFYTKRTLKKRKIANKIANFTDSKGVQTSIQYKTSDNLTSTSTQSPIIAITSSSQQTIATLKTNPTKVRECQMIKTRKLTKSCQTDLITDSKGVQCKQNTFQNGTQTDKNVKDSSTQAQVDVNISAKIKNSTQVHKYMTSSANINDIDVIIYMLNEIGEAVISQSQILDKSSEILKQFKQNYRFKNNLRNSWRLVYPFIKLIIHEAEIEITILELENCNMRC